MVRRRGSSSDAKTYFFLLGAAVTFAFLSKNLMRTRIGRSWTSMRDRDIAAEVMGVNETESKTQAFAISSFYAGVAGALYAVVLGRVIPESWDLLLSVEFIAIILIGGAGTVAGSLLGALFFVMTPRRRRERHAVAGQPGGVGWFPGARRQPVVATGLGRLRVVSTSARARVCRSSSSTSSFRGADHLFLIAEPLGLFGIWVTVSNYWKGWPFTY